MRFLVDAQLPIALARWITENGHEAIHVADCGLAETDDRVVWAHALESGAVIVSKDEDFPSRRALSAQGPSVVWVRIGNASRRETLRWFATVFPDVLAALARGDTLVEIA
jgi:predicted nuclease of predicted toxin-antitoxin system